VGDDAPYRAILTRLAATNEASLSLPEPEEGEDCVEGSLVWGGRHIEIYFECQVLSFLQFWSSDREAVDAVQKEISRQQLGRKRPFAQSISQMILALRSHG
jgi:hypothetical protein